jgi:hypothetical protein
MFISLLFDPAASLSHNDMGGEHLHDDFQYTPTDTTGGSRTAGLDITLNRKPAVTVTAAPMGHVSAQRGVS